MADITEKLLSFLEEIELSKKARSLVLASKEEIIRLRKENKALVDGAKNEILILREERSEAEVEILRLREGLRELRHGIFKDSDAVEGFIDGLLKVEINKEF